MARPNIFTLGGTVQAGGGRYIPRHADEELLALCRDASFAFVLTARQMGKSSLMVRTAQRLAVEGTRSVIVDLTQIGVQIDVDSWYFGLLTVMADSLELELDVYEWWKEHEKHGYTQRLTQFFEEMLSSEVKERVVIFIDEIDSTLSLSFTDDFFAAIRYVYNARSIVPAFNRLSFVLIGVATPIDLISDPRRTPFNIGRDVDLDTFSLQEAAPLADGFDLPREESEEILRQIIWWTGGHPYLTQRLCSIVAARLENGQVDVDRAVAETFFGENSENDTNLRFVHDMLTRRAVDPLAVLSTYQHILRGRTIADDNRSPTITHLKLSGVVGRKGGALEIRNRIYATVFNREWVKEQWPESWYRRVPPVVIGLAAALFAAVILLGLFLLQTQKALQAEEQSTLQEAHNAMLSQQITVSDSLRREAERAISELSHQIRVVDSLRAAEKAANTQLSEQIRVAESLNLQLNMQMEVTDSLRMLEFAANRRLSDQIQVTDSMRLLAEARLKDANDAALETMTIALASKALRQVKLGDPELGALLARQALTFGQRGDGEFMDPVYDAMLQSLNALNDAGTAVFAGPQVFRDHAAGVRAVAFSPDGRWMATAGEDGVVGLWSTSAKSMKMLSGHKAAVRALAFHPDGDLLASAGDDHTVRFWDKLAADTPKDSIVGRHEGGVWAIAFSPDGDRLASAGADRTVIIRSVRQPQVESALPLSSDARVRTVAFSPDGRQIAAGSEDGRLHVWQQDSSAPLSWSAGQGRVLAIAFSRTGQLIASAGDMPELRLWRVPENGGVPQLEQRLRGHEGPVNALAFSPDDRVLASGSADASVQLWSVERLDKSPIILQDHSSWVWSVAFSPDGARLATSSNDRTVRLWDIQPEHLAQKICTATAGRELSPEEWDQFVGGDFPYGGFYEPCDARPAAEPASSTMQHDVN